MGGPQPFCTSDVDGRPYSQKEAVKDVEEERGELFTYELQ
jgi:hypothetical protein